MTPTLLRKVLVAIPWSRGKFVAVAICAFLMGAIILGVLYPLLNANALFFAWPFFCVAILSAGVVLAISLYARDKNFDSQPLSAACKLNYGVLSLMAPFVTLWFIAGLAMALGGVILGVAHIFGWYSGV